MSTITPKSLDDFKQSQLDKWLALLPNANTNDDSMISIDATVFAEMLYLLQQDAITLSNNSFLAYATWDELSNLWLDRGIPRKEAKTAVWKVTFSRGTIAEANYTITSGTQVGTQPSGNWQVIIFTVDSDVTLYWSISTPTSLAWVQSSTWGTIWNGTYSYTVTAVNWNWDETDESNTADVVISNWLSTNQISLTWNSVPRAVSYVVYLDWVKLDETTTPSYTDILWDTWAETQTPPTSNATGSLSVIADITAAIEGTVWNVWPNVITNLVEKPLWIETVTNVNATSGGTDLEEDEDYRLRIRAQLESNVWKVTAKGYEQTALEVSGVKSATAIHETGEPINAISVFIVAEGSNPIPSTTLLNEVTAYLNLDENRAVCDVLTAKAPTVDTIDVTIDVTEYDMTNYTESEMTDVIEAAIEDFLASIAIEGTIRVVDLENAIYVLEWITDFSLTAPSSNITLGANTMAAPWVITVTFS